MGKELEEMSLEELWELFPIRLVAHSDKWVSCYGRMKARLERALEGCRVERISHIGSTAIDGIRAKDIVDVLVEIAQNEDMESVAEAVESCGFIRMAASARGVSFNRGYTQEGFAEEVFHLHLRRAGDNGELYFRDYLNDHPPIAEQYEALKLRLQRLFEHDRDAYTQAKSEFVRKWTAEAKKLYAGRY